MKISGQYIFTLIAALLMTNNMNVFADEYYTGEILKELTTNQCGEKKIKTTLQLTLRNDNTWDLHYIPKDQIYYVWHDKSQDRIAYGNYERRNQRIIFNSENFDQNYSSFNSSLPFEIAALCDKIRHYSYEENIKKFSLVSNKEGNKIKLLVSRTGKNLLPAQKKAVKFKHSLKGTLRKTTTSIAPLDCTEYYVYPPEECVIYTIQ